MNSPDPLAAMLRSAGCVFAEDEATILRDAAGGDAGLLQRLCVRRIHGEPLEHVVGWVAFAGRRLSVGPGVFVPRRRSELLAAVTLGAAAQIREPTVLEDYCGVAPIAATVAAHLPAAHVHATDIDEHALVHARRNVGDDRVYRGDGLAGVPTDLRGAITVLAAVPPYVPAGALALLPHEAAEHEPRRALLAGADGLDEVRRLIVDAHAWLAPGGHLAIEMNTTQADVIAAEAGENHTVARFADADGQTAVLRLTCTGG
ncbi:N5-glutamine methyltransferase family protein [Gordonia desulfuricans]|nr:SAM-dependent methyltransferase [Gordonia desulfuricans]